MCSYHTSLTPGQPHKHNTDSNPNTLLSVLKGNTDMVIMCNKEPLKFEAEIQANVMTVPARSKSRKHYLNLCMFMHT